MTSREKNGTLKLDKEEIGTLKYDTVYTDTAYMNLDAIKCQKFEMILNGKTYTEKDLEILEKYRKLFETIKKQNLSLEYTGYEFMHYYKDIENKEKNNE